MGREQDSHPLPRDLSLREGTTHPDHSQALPCLGATFMATPRVLLAQCRRVLGHCPPQNAPWDQLGHSRGDGARAQLGSSCPGPLGADNAL